MAIAYPLTSQEGGTSKWNLSRQSGLEGETNDSNGVQLAYIVTHDNFHYNAIGTDGKTYTAIQSYYSDLTTEQMHGESEEEMFPNKTHIGLISIFAIVVIACSGILISNYIPIK